jgi:hypothetical protein
MPPVPPRPSAASGVANQQLVAMLKRVRHQKATLQGVKRGWRALTWVQRLVVLIVLLTSILILLYSFRVMMSSKIYHLTQEARLLHEENLNLEVNLTELTSIQHLESVLPRLQGMVEASEKWQLVPKPEDETQGILQGTEPLQRGTVYRFAQAW